MSRRFDFDTAGVLDRLHARHNAIRPAAGEPGSLAEQANALSLFWDDPSRKYDRNAAWQAARALSMEHARRRER